ncbi:RluA family pseudouridine synthase [Macrococcus sp. DPC7161]|uniref:RluA family pseudouridine synthase n=1 Tax=Macrococcus sp. DPC7161 TaxID=2507060 RepID=UPI00100AE054|nr:RluA family pseudouridine synthase [Macrococcus sp. DPC7161]RXK18769.1 RluA family pseudouridine synthase [Macrococcus sp. DPC7161]
MSRLNFVVDENVLLRSFLQNQNISKKSLSTIKQNGALLVNGCPVTVRYQLSIGDVVEIILPKESHSPNLIPSSGEVTVLYEDAHICIVDKPAFMNTIPSQLHPHDSLIERVLYHFQKMGDESNPHPVNRLDRNTSGIVVFAKHQLMHHLMTGIIEKYYIANVVGDMKNHGNICTPIERARDSIITRMVSIYGKHARTEYQLLNKNHQYSQLWIRLHTGRTHQIRVHFASMNHPLQGDTLYGLDDTINRHALHAVQIKFVHPITYEVLTISSPCPTDMQLL